MDITIFGENRHPNPYLFVHYVVEPRGQARLIEIFRQCLPYMPRYEYGDVIKFDISGNPNPKQVKRYIVDRVVNYIVCMHEAPTDPNIPQFQNQIYVIMREQPLAENAEIDIEKLKGRYDMKLERPGDPNSAIYGPDGLAPFRKRSRKDKAPGQPDKNTSGDSFFS